MTLVVTVVFKNPYGLKLSNGRTKRPLPMLLISNRRCGGVARLGHARIIGNARCSAPVTDVRVTYLRFSRSGSSGLDKLDLEVEIDN